MGASWFQQVGYGKTLDNAYKIACEEAEDEYGHQEGYNGTISTTTYAKDITQEYHRSKLDLEQFVRSKMEMLNKRDCCAICLQEPVGNKNKTKSQVEHIVTPGTKKWVLKYTVRHGDHFIGSWNTKGDAVKDARRYTENNQVATTIEMEKVLDKGSNRVAIIKYKKAPTERPGKWMFFGWAAE
jgi:S-methylmethionine-dependent homocysteine/selenocysteine methylase